MPRIYVDHNSTTPLLPDALAAMQPYLTGQFGNPSSIHRWGRSAHVALETARAQVARLLNAQDDEIIFTSGGTEANNLALQGLGEARRSRGAHLILSAIEHVSVLEVGQRLAQRGFQVTYVPPDRDGLIDPQRVADALTDETILVSMMAANNEVGTLQPIEAIGGIVKAREILFHVDAVQAAGKLSIDLQRWQADAVSVSAHKLYGPKGAGALYLRRGTPCQPLWAGGHHEQRFRPGTENLPAIVGFGVAAQHAQTHVTEEAAHLLELRARLETRLMSESPGTVLNGHPTQRLANTVNLGFEGCAGETMVMNLDVEGIAASVGAACSSGSIEPSHVLLAMGRTPEQALGCVRFSLGRGNTLAEMDEIADTVQRILPRVRRLPAAASA